MFGGSDDIVLSPINSAASDVAPLEFPLQEDLRTLSELGGTGTFVAAPLQPKCPQCGGRTYDTKCTEYRKSEAGPEGWNIRWRICANLKRSKVGGLECGWKDKQLLDSVPVHQEVAAILGKEVERPARKIEVVGPAVADVSTANAAFKILAAQPAYRVLGLMSRMSVSERATVEGALAALRAGRRT